jgi:hypothetical protein
MKPKAAALGFAFICALAGGGCSMALDENSVVYSSAPGKYDYLDCKGIAERTEANVKRTTELTALMQRASQDGGAGPVIGNLVYRDEYNIKQADTLALRHVADDKRCAPDLTKKPLSTLSPMH